LIELESVDYRLVKIDRFCWNYTTTWRTDRRTDTKTPIIRSAELMRGKKKPMMKF